jgi:hypothetical protein
MWWKKWYWDRFFSEYSDFHLSVSFHQCLIAILLHTLFFPGQAGKHGTFKKQCSFGKWGST